MTVLLIREGQTPQAATEQRQLDIDAVNPFAALVKVRERGIEIESYWLDGTDLWVAGYDMADGLREQLARLGSTAEVTVNWQSCQVLWRAVAWSGKLATALEAVLGIEPDPQLGVEVEGTVLRALRDATIMEASR